MGDGDKQESLSSGVSLHSHRHCCSLISTGRFLGCGGSRWPGRGFKALGLLLLLPPASSSGPGSAHPAAPSHPTAHPPPALSTTFPQIAIFFQEGARALSAPFLTPMRSIHSPVHPPAWLDTTISSPLSKTRGCSFSLAREQDVLQAGWTPSNIPSSFAGLLSPGETFAQGWS